MSEKPYQVDVLNADTIAVRWADREIVVEWYEAPSVAASPPDGFPARPTTPAWTVVRVDGATVHEPLGPTITDFDIAAAAEATYRRYVQSGS